MNDHFYDIYFYNFVYGFSDILNMFVKFKL